MQWLIKIYQQNKRIFSITILVLCFVFSQESQCRLTKEESIVMVKEAVAAEYITSDTAGKLIAYFEDPRKRKSLGSALFRALPLKISDDIIVEAEKILDITHHSTNNVKRLRAIANLLLPCWTGGMTCYRVTKQAHSLSFLLYSRVGKNVLRCYWFIRRAIMYHSVEYRQDVLTFCNMKGN
ncbi:MAG: hypothetical protein LBT63_01750, partial [Holosporaceae bacterium]|nr:hypothetical protein [Holosporaceae bacterium]